MNYFIRFTSLPIFLCLFKISIAQSTFSSAQKADSLISSALNELNMKTAYAISLVNGDKVLFQKVYGYRNIEEKIPADKTTVFYIASSTKSFMGLAMRILEEQGKIDFDDPLSKYLTVRPKTFSLDSISIKDLLIHNSGVRNDPIQLRTSYTEVPSDKKLEWLFSNSVKRTKTFEYVNMGYVMAGVILDRETKNSWKNYFRNAIFIPARMMHTSTYVPSVKSSIASPYELRDSFYKKYPLKTDKIMNPAGGVFSNIEDMTKWVSLNITNGKQNGTKIFSAEVMKDTHEPHIYLSKTYYRYNRVAYGYGWYVGLLGDDTLVHQFGGYEGYKTHVSFMPQRKFGVVVLSNNSGKADKLTDVFACLLYELVLGKDSAIYNFQKGIEQCKEELNTKAGNGNEGWSYLSTNKEVLGKYNHDQFGEIELQNRKGRIWFIMGNLQSPVLYKDGLYKILDYDFLGKFKIYPNVNPRIEMNLNRVETTFLKER